MFGEASAVGCFKHHDVLAKEAPLGAAPQLKQRQSCEKEALLGPGFPAFLDRLRFIVQFLPNEFGHPGEVVLTAPPTVGHGLVFGHRHVVDGGTAHPFDGSFAPHATTIAPPLIIVWMRIGDLDERETRILKHEIHGA
jgi:hypothetical protein